MQETLTFTDLASMLYYLEQSVSSYDGEIIIV